MGEPHRKLLYDIEQNGTKKRGESFRPHPRVVQPTAPNIPSDGMIGKAVSPAEWVRYLNTSSQQRMFERYLRKGTFEPIHTMNGKEYKG